MSRAPGSYVGLTSKQADLLSFIRFCEADGQTPSFEEMKDAIELGSKSGIHRLVTALEERGYVERIPNRHRAIRTIAEPTNAIRRPTSSELRTTPLSALIAELERRRVIKPGSGLGALA